MKVLGIYREAVYSPGKVADDAAILDSALKELARCGFETSALHPEDAAGALPRADLVLSMAQSEAALRMEERWQEGGIRILNSPKSVRNCYRKPLIELLSTSGERIPRSSIMTLSDAEKQLTSRDRDLQCWLKRGDVHAVETGDVVKVACVNDVVKALGHFRRRGIGELLVQEHVEGPTVKFYGVGEGEFFRAFLSSSGAQLTSWTGDLMRMAIRSAEVLGLEIYGGDAILSNGDGPTLVDLNDWPSYSSCRLSAAKGIAEHVLRQLGRQVPFQRMVRS